MIKKKRKGQEFINKNKLVGMLKKQALVMTINSHSLKGKIYSKIYDCPLIRG